MMAAFNQTASGRTAIEDMHAELETYYLQEYLAAHGYSQATLALLAQPEIKRIMTDASTYASTQLACCESRARLIHELHATDH